MKARIAVALMSVLALAACNSGRNDDGDGERSARGERGNGDAPGDGAGGNAAAGDTSALEQQFALAAAAAKARLPMQQDGATITNLEANGTELITSMTLPSDLTQAQADQIAGPMCNDPRMVALIRRGATISYRITDSGGEQFSISVSSCPD